jgi:D-proline reductase (dithiol) PrdB|tara:strand:- start:7263 stop:8450 length:1188 start_codon:yes stop_codon:yes gene_type:complete
MSVFGKDELAMRKFASSMPVPEFEETHFVTSKPLSQAKVAIVTTAGLHRENMPGFEIGDSDFHYETLARHIRDLQLGHHSVNFDRGGFAADFNVVYPIDRLEELAIAGVIGAVAENHYAFAGNQSATVSEIRLDSGPHCAGKMLAENVDVVLLTGTCPLCPRTVCTLAHIFEAAGLATIVITRAREIAERMKVPRALHTVFPPGLSLGKPRDKAFQVEVLKAAFKLLESPQGPVIEEFPISISASDGEPLTCSLPPQMNPRLHPAVDEAEALKSAYYRAYKRNKRTSVGMQISVEEIPQALEKFAKIAGGELWTEVGFPNDSIAEVMYGTVHDIRSYYEELACELADGPIGPWKTEQWFYDNTKAGQTILQARRAMRDSEADSSLWFGLATAGRE